MPRDFYEDSDPRFAPTPNRPRSTGLSVYAPTSEWQRKDWRYKVAASAARAVLDRYIYRLIAERTVFGPPLFSEELHRLLVDGDRTAALILLLTAKDGRKRLIRDRVQYLRWLGVVTTANKHGTIAIEYYSPDRAPSRVRWGSAQTTATDIPCEGSANDLRGPCGEMRSLRNGPGDVPGLLPAP